MRASYRSWKCLSLLVFIPFFASTPLSAVENRWTNFGIRPLGMGNAFVAVADDHNALFYNPAGLARLKDWKLELINPHFEMSLRTINLINSTVKKAKDKKFQDTGEALGSFTEISGQNQSLAIKYTPYFISPNFGVAFSTENLFSLVFHQQIELDIQLQTINLAPIAFAANFFEKRLSLGVGIKGIYTTGVNSTFSIDSISALTSSSSKKFDDYIVGGQGLGTDLGLLFTPIDVMEPTLGVSISDFGGTPLKKITLGKVQPKVAPSRLPSVNTGISFKPMKTERTYLLFAVDAHSINQPIHYSHKLNFGGELGLSKILKLQAGLHDGDITAGLQFDVGLLTLRLATYTVDLAPVVGLDKELMDRRVAFQFKLLI